MRFDRIRKLFRSLRFRLSVWNTAAVLLLVVLTLVGVREALYYRLRTENDHVLLDDAFEVVLAVESFYPKLDQIQEEMDRKAKGHVDRGLFVQLLDTRGQLIWASGPAPALSHLKPPNPNSPTLVSVGNYRVVQRAIDNHALPPYVVRVGASLAMINNDMSTLTQLMTAAGIAIVFIAPLSGYFLAGRATRPLARIISTASRLRPSHLEERLPIRGTQDELDQLSLTINHFLDLLNDYLKRNREFVANAAHELRSPLAAVQSSVEVTLNTSRTVGEYQDLLGEIADQCEQLRVLVNQLLLLAETDARSVVEMRPLAFDRLIGKSVEMFRGVAEERGINLLAHLDEDVMIHGDPDRLRQVINNLIDNGLKFTAPGGGVVVSLRRDRGGLQAVFQVSDTGVGISANDLPHVFERFYRGDKSRQRESVAHGNGLGLSICESIVSGHGGTIRAESSGRGATFTVALPLLLEEQPSQVAGLHAGQSG